MFSNVINFFTEGGIFMVPLVLASVIAVALMLERGLALRRERVIPAALAEAIDELRHGGSTRTLEQLSAGESTTLARLVRFALRHLPWPKYENAEALQTKARAEVSRLERGLVVLEIITGIGPLLGLLGAVSGLVTIFADVGYSGPLDTQGLQIARGIAEALHTTIAGLAVAIPSLIAHSIYIRRIDSFAVELESLTVDLLGKIYTEKETPAAE